MKSIMTLNSALNSLQAAKLTIPRKGSKCLQNPDIPPIIRFYLVSSRKLLTFWKLNELSVRDTQQKIEFCIGNSQETKITHKICSLDQIHFPVPSWQYFLYNKIELIKNSCASLLIEGQLFKISINSFKR